jgi:glucose/arabinose dehydrogenase
VQRRTLLRAGLVSPVVLAGCSGSVQSSPRSGPSAGSGSPSTGAGPTFAVHPPGMAAGTQPRITQVLARRLDVPWGITFLPSGDALVAERDSGRIVRVPPHGGWRPVGKVPGVVSNVSVGGEGGLLGLALRPGSSWLYVYHSTRTDNRVVRMQYRNGRLGAPLLVLKGIRKAVHHNGGALAFGPGGLLYVSTGDAEVSSDAQDKHSLNGKVLRLTPTGSVPRGNPFGNPVWSYGHRNVEGLTFDDRGRLWASEFGESTADELNRIERGGNYGWPFVQGRDGPGGYRDPIAQWPTDQCSPSGVTVLAGRAWLAALQGQCLYSVGLSPPHRHGRFFAGRFGRLRMVKAAPDGSLWFGTSNRDGRGAPAPADDRIFRVAL